MSTQELTAMTWYCANCGYMNSVKNDLYCCHCHQIRDNLASKYGGLPSIAGLNEPSATQATGYNTHEDNNHEHYKASPANCLDLDLAFTDPTSAPPQNPKKGKWKKVWFCCNCNDGPHGAENIPACNCGHIQCTRCKVEVVRMQMELNPLD